MFVIGLDVGTSGVKSTLFDDETNVLAHAYREYNLICEQDGMFELDPNLLLQKTVEVIQESVAGWDAKQVRAICVTSFGESFVCMDAGGNVLSNTMIYMDKRGTLECEEFLSVCSEEEIYNISGQFVDPMFAVCKLRWIQKNNPALLERTKKISFITDFITHRLGAEHCCDYSLAARSGMFNLEQKTWWHTALNFAGVNSEMLPKPVPGGSVVGTLSKAVAEKLGMNADVKLIVGGHDQILAAVGSGANQPGDIANGMGTVDCMTVVLDANTVRKETLLKYKLPMVPFLADGKYVTYAFNMSGGCTVKWFRDVLALDMAQKPDAYKLLDREAAQKPTGLFVIPYFAGGGTPYMDNDLPAVMAGMRLNTTRGELYRAFLEGESYEMRLSLECLEEAGLQAQKISTVGGGAKSPLWMQLRADIFDKEVHILKNNEAGTLASAMLCYTNLGLYSNVYEAQKACVQTTKHFIPQKSNAAEYNRYYAKYKAIYKAMKEVYP